MKKDILTKDIANAFKPFDVNRDGLVTRKEFHRGLQSVAPKTTLEDTKQLLESVTSTYGDGDLVPYANVSNMIAKISNEQHDTFKKMESERLKIERISMQTSKHADLAENRLLTRFSGSSSRLRHALKCADTDGDHRLDPTQFKRSLLQLNVDINENQIDKLIAKYDVDNNGTIDYDKFVDSIETAKNNTSGKNGERKSRSPSSLAKDVVDKMFKNSSVEMMAKHFRDLNIEKCGTLDSDTVERGLRLQGANLSKKDMDALLHATKSPYKKNRVDYRKLVNLMQNADLPEEQFQNPSSNNKTSSPTVKNLAQNGNYNISTKINSSNNIPWWDRQNQDQNFRVADDGSETIIESSAEKTVKALNGRQTRRRASLHLQKTDILPTSSPLAAKSKYFLANNGVISKGGDGIHLRKNIMNTFGRERTKLERTEAIINSRIANAIDDKMNRLKQVYDDKAYCSSGSSSLTYKQLRNGFRDCGINLGTEDFNRLVSTADKSNVGTVSFDNIVNVVKKSSLGIPKDVTYFANQHYTKTSNKVIAAGRPSNTNHNVVYNDGGIATNDANSNNAQSKSYYMSSSLFQNKDIYQDAAPTYVTSVMRQPSTEFLANNRRKSASPSGSSIRPNTSVEFGRSTGNILLADSLVGKIPLEYPQGHLYGQSGHAVARDGRRQMKQPEQLSEKESGHRLKDLLYNSGAAIGADETDVNYGVSKRINVSLHGRDAAGRRTVDSRALRRRVAPEVNIHGSEGVTASFNANNSNRKNKQQKGKQRRSGKRRIGKKNVSQFHHNRATPVNYHTYNMYKNISPRRSNVTPRSSSSSKPANTKIIHF
eukprot:g8748.t1